MTNLDTTRFDGLSEAEILRRIGAILAAAIIRSGRLSSKNAKVRADRGDHPAPEVAPLRLIADPLEQQIAEYLCYTGTASPVELRQALGLRPRSLTRALARLRRGGLCEVVGQTQAARYQLRNNFAQN